MENNQKQKVTDIHRNRNKQTYIEKKNKQRWIIMKIPLFPKVF